MHVKYFPNRDRGSGENAADIGSAHVTFDILF